MQLQLGNGNPQDGFADSCQPGTRHYGTLGRNSLIGPNYRNFDFAFSKTTALTERWQLLLRADFFNLTNHPNFANDPLGGCVLCRCGSESRSHFAGQCRRDYGINPAVPGEA